MCLYVQFSLILIALGVSKAAIIEVHNESPQQKRYCEVFQSTNFDGESVTIPESYKINDFTQLTKVWIHSDDGDTFHSFKLPSIPTTDGISCLARSCTKVNFQGNCTVFKVSQERIEPSQLKSFECNCFHGHVDKRTDSTEATRIGIYDGKLTDEVKQSCEHESIFQNFTKLGKTIIGVGRNYVWHKKSDLSTVVASGSNPEEPIIFLKPTSSYLLEGNLIHLPHSLGIIYYEIELAVVIGKSTRNVSEMNAMDYVAGYALALDMTAKEILKSSISKGLPWTVAKGFDGACPIGNFIPKECIPNPHDLQLTAIVNGVTKQNDSTSQMIFKIPQLISYVSQFMTLEPYDVILTGTPDGFGAVKSGDVIEGSANGNLAKIKFVVA